MSKKTFKQILKALVIAFSVAWTWVAIVLTFSEDNTTIIPWCNLVGVTMIFAEYICWSYKTSNK